MRVFGSKKPSVKKSPESQTRDKILARNLQKLMRIKPQQEEKPHGLLTRKTSLTVAGLVNSGSIQFINAAQVPDEPTPLTVGSGAADHNLMLARKYSGDVYIESEEDSDNDACT